MNAMTMWNLLVCFNLGKWLNNELAWVMNTNNHGGDWPHRVFGGRP